MSHVRTRKHNEMWISISQKARLTPTGELILLRKNDFSSLYLEQLLVRIRRTTNIILGLRPDKLHGESA